MRVLYASDGRRLHYLATSFAGRGHVVTAIARGAEECSRLAKKGLVTVVQGDPSDPSVLEDAGARRADVFLGATTSDPDNLIACQMAMLRFQVPRTIALVNDPENEEVFRGLGVEAFSTGQTVASLVEQRTALQAVTELVPVGNGAVRIVEVTLLPSSPVLGRTLAECVLPADALIAVVTRAGHALIPHGSTELRAGDRVLVVALAASSDAALLALTGPSSKRQQ
jgi:trk system potassium uptake protein TrkA